MRTEEHPEVNYKALDESALEVPDGPNDAVMSEVALIERCKSGDSRAWETLIKRYERSVYRLAHRLSHNHDDASDITVQTFLRVYLHLCTFRDNASFPSWLFRIVRNIYIDECVRPAHRRDLSLSAPPREGNKGGAFWEIPDPRPSPEAACLDGDAAKRLTLAVRHLPGYQQEVIMMFQLEGKSYREIAADTGLTIGTVKSRLNRARAMLRMRLDKRESDATMPT